jgi:hypothetical protein
MRTNMQRRFHENYVACIGDCHQLSRTETMERQMEKRNNLASSGALAIALALGELDSADACQKIQDARAFIQAARTLLKVLMPVADDAAMEINAAVPAERI